MKVLLYQKWKQINVQLIIPRKCNSKISSNKGRVCWDIYLFSSSTSQDVVSFKKLSHNLTINLERWKIWFSENHKAGRRWSYSSKLLQECQECRYVFLSDLHNRCWWLCNCQWSVTTEILCAKSAVLIIWCGHQVMTVKLIRRRPTVDNHARNNWVKGKVAA